MDNRPLAAACLFLVGLSSLASAHLTNPDGSLTSALHTGDGCRYGGAASQNGGNCTAWLNSGVSGTYVGAANDAANEEAACPGLGCWMLCDLEVGGVGSDEGSEEAAADAAANERVVDNDDSGSLPTAPADGTWDDGGLGGACHTSSWSEDDPSASITDPASPTGAGKESYNTYGCSGTSHAEDLASAHHVWIMAACDWGMHVKDPCFVNVLLAGGNGLEECLASWTCTLDCSAGEFVSCGSDGAFDDANLGEGGGDARMSAEPAAPPGHGLGTNDAGDPGAGVPYPAVPAECASVATAATLVLRGVEAYVREDNAPVAEYTTATAGWIDWSADPVDPPIPEEDDGIRVEPCGNPYSISIGTGQVGGVPLAPGLPDPRWTVGSNPAGVPAGMAATVASPYPGWLSPTDAAWISASASTATSLTTPTGTYAYELEFLLLPGLMAKRIVFEAAADNGVEFFLNGYSLGGFHAGTSQDFGTWHPFSYEGFLFLDGVNTLRAEVVNDGSVTGLLVRGSVYGCKPCLDASYLYPLDTGVPSRWQVGSNPASVPPGDAATVPPYSGWMVPAGPAWISASAATGTSATGAPKGTYVYESTFNLPSGFHDAELSIEVAADNGAQLFLNSNPLGGFHTGGPSDFNSWHAFAALNGAFTPGANVLRIEVENDSGPTGLLVRGQASTQACN